MTEETQALVERLRAIAAANVCDLPNMGDEAHEPPEITWGELDAIGRTADAAAAALSMLSRDLAAARACPDCQQPLACPAGTAERIAGLEAMHEETLTRAERAEADLAVARQERAEAQRGEQAWVEIAAQDARDAADRLAAAVRAARAETWAEAAAWHEGMAESSVIPSLRPLHQQYAANFRERARLAAREEQ